MHKFGRNALWLCCLALALASTLGMCQGCGPVGYVQWAIATGGHAKKPASQATPQPEPATN